MRIQTALILSLSLALACTKDDGDTGDTGSLPPEYQVSDADADAVFHKQHHKLFTVHQ
ncbi:MAG: hypothetical protein H8D71_01280, partial [Deltaproteobacteria bacterium]|nr:hypothetical protein [Deltaproteobacteria bacterium]